MQRPPATADDKYIIDAERPNLAIGCFASICRDRLADASWKGERPRSGSRLPAGRRTVAPPALVRSDW